MQVLRLVAGVIALVGLGLHSWMLVQLGRWSRLPHAKPASANLSFWGLFYGLVAVVGLALAAASIVGVVLPGVIGSPGEHLYVALFSLGFAWMVRHGASYHLLHVRAYAATRRLFSIAERLATQHGGDAAGMRRVADRVLNEAPPDFPDQPWHGSPPLWSAELFRAVQRRLLTDAELTELDDAMARCVRAAGRFDGNRR